MATKNIYIQCRVNSQEKEDWKKFAQEQNFPSVSELVRFSVNKAMELEFKRTTNWTFLKKNIKGNKTAYIRVRIFEEDKKKWDKYIEDMKLPSISELVRLSVYKIIENEIQKEIQMNNRMFLFYRNNRYYQDELNQLIDVPSCKNCGLRGLVWWDEEGLCLECSIKKNKKQTNQLERKKNEISSLKDIVIQLPENLIREIDKELEINNELAYRSYTEFIIDATRHRLEEVKGLRI